MTLHVPRWADVAGGAEPQVAATRAGELLLTAPWLAHVGTPSDRDGEVARVTAWRDALAMFSGGLDVDDLAFSTNAGGTLNAPMIALLTAADSHPRLYAEPNRAAHAVLDAMTGYVTAVRRAARASGSPDDLDTMVLLGDYVTEYVRMLFLEMYFGDDLATPSTYFRDQLGWFAGGFLPCGWDGDWPIGRMRVF